MHHRIRAISLALTITCCYPAIAFDEPRPPSNPVPLAITVRGGASLGAYEAGYLFFLIETIKRHQSLYDFRLITGASAGTINTFLVAMEMGSDPRNDPQDSYLYQVWTSEHLGYKQLLDVKQAPPGALSSRASLKKIEEEYKEAWLSQLNRPFELVLGMATTKLRPQKIELKPGLEVIHQETTFGIKVGRTEGVKHPQLTNHLYGKPGAPPTALLPLEMTSSPSVQYKMLMDLLFASAAFPMAFPPKQLQYCLSGTTDEADQPAVCSKPDHTSSFVDGGLFANSPLHLAQRLATSMNEPVTSDIQYIFVDPVNAAYESPETTEDDNDSNEPYSLTKTLGMFAKDMVGSAYTDELYTLAEQHPEVIDRILVTTRHYPIVSDQLGAFFGFFETDFRKFDFYLGLYDAARNLSELVDDPSKVNQVFSRALSMTNDITTGHQREGWKPFFCMRTFYDTAEMPKQCSTDKSLENFLILLRVSQERLNDPRGDRDDFDFVMKLLAKRHFHFEDLGLSKEDADNGMIKIRSLIQEWVDDYTAKLKTSEKAIVSTLAKPAINFFKYSPPKRILYAWIGKGAELGYSRRAGERRVLRGNIALQFQGFSTLSWTHPVFVFTPVIGPEFELLGTPMHQLHTGIRIGYQLSTDGGFSESTCDLSENSMRCSAPLGQLFFAYSLFERLRIQLTAEWSPPWIPGVPPKDSHLWNFLLGVGWQWLP